MSERRSGTEQGSRYRAVIRLGPFQEFYNITKLLTGLSRLQRQGRLQLSFLKSERDCGIDTLVEVEVAFGEMRRRIIFDLADRSDLFARDVLVRCDTYFKRSYYVPDVTALPPDERMKVQSFGLNYPCWGSFAAQRLPLSIMFRKVKDLLAASLPMKKNWRTKWNEVKRFVSLPRVAEYELRPEEPVEAAVLFQTRVWEPEDILPDNSTEINETRVSVVRALKRAFGDRFWGGLVPTPYAIQHFPDAITNIVCRPRNYIACSKRALVGVYTRGLHHSIAFKLPEYLASSKAIVADGFRNELPCELAEGRDYLGFSDPAECVEQCSRLLQDPGLTDSMRQTNHRYYMEEVEPSVHILKCLDRAFEQLSARGAGCHAHGPR